jgi:hypothetical protein
MAAVEMFESVLAELSDKERAAIEDSIKGKRTDLLAARSEEARVRLVSEFQREVRDLLARPAR